MSDHKTDRVLAFLQDIYPTAQFLPSIGEKLGINANTLRGMLPRLVKRGDAERVSPGCYKATKPRKPAETTIAVVT